MLNGNLTKAQAAARADVSEATVSRAIESGLLPATKEPGRVLIAPRDCDRWIESRRQPIEPRKEQTA